MTVKIFSFSEYNEMASALQRSDSFECTPFRLARYDNLELHATVPPITGEHCLVLGSIAPPDERLLSLLLLAHTLKQGGATQVSAILPYLSYTRQDKVKPGESLATAWVGSLLATSGFTLIVTVDVHSERTRELVPVPLISLSPAKLFAAEIHKHGLMDATIVAVDEGAIARCEAVGRAAGMPVNDIPYFKKHRTAQGIQHGELNGRVGRRVIFVDDILDTGGTLVSASKKLIEAQVEEIYVFVTHGLFTGEAWRKLWALRTKRIYCTDTVQPLRPGIGAENITVLSTVPLIQEHLKDRLILEAPRLVR